MATMLHPVELVEDYTPLLISQSVMVNCQPAASTQLQGWARRAADTHNRSRQATGART
jgi:hypothetical protein